MKIASAQAKRILYILVGFAAGMVFNSYLESLSEPRVRRPSTGNSSVSSALSKYMKPGAPSPTNFTIDYHNILQFYEEFYRYYELNKEW